MSFFAERQNLIKKQPLDLRNKLLMLTEVEVDGQQAEDAEQPADYTADTGDTQETAQENENSEQGADENPEDQQNNENNNPNDDNPEDDSTDYTTMGDEGEDASDNGDDTGSDEGNSSGGGEDEEQPVDDLKQQEEELLSNLTPEQLDIKHKELKNQYLAMYDMVNSLIERIGDIAVNEQDIGTIEYVSTNLSKMKDMITDYMNSMYQTKSYIENSINYNRFLAILNGINKILEEMGKKED